jgi:hypothetical protein
MDFDAFVVSVAASLAKFFALGEALGEQSGRGSRTARGGMMTMIMMMIETRDALTLASRGIGS